METKAEIRHSIDIQKGMLAFIAGAYTFSNMSNPDGLLAVTGAHNVMWTLTCMSGLTAYYLNNASVNDAITSAACTHSGQILGYFAAKMYFSTVDAGAVSALTP